MLVHPDAAAGAPRDRHPDRRCRRGLGRQLRRPGRRRPDEALADATEESHDVTTPDEPADVVDVSPGEEPIAKKSAKP